ncbi:chromate transporter [Aggregicoccus sp. 17bor-14]|uniref:chromate transporter n=1 Tax=Myxococcaceae TaxID=31 RepID=UPI00129CD581|nr:MULTISPECIES: chromate transporter [Myxococcaceae]MBF5046532.1 chromate transporter [Simulacricoccus sp. 17bor-14]MRI92245.1 chromate transporter [Aggregicoccus sp. 17bor-14]
MTAPTPPVPLPPASKARPRPSLGELLRLSLYLGLVGFGGGVSVLAIIESLVVARHGWLTPKEFANTATIAQMLPGGAATNTLAQVGLRFHGVRGAAVTYGGFVLPGALSIGLLAWAYVHFGALPHADAFLAGLNAAVVGVIGAITVKMARTSVVRLWQMGVVALALLLTLVGQAGPLEVAFLGIAGGLGWDLGIERARLLRFGRKRFQPAPQVGLPDEGGTLQHAAGPESAESAAPREPASPPRPPGMLWLLPAGSLLPGALMVLLPMAVIFFRIGLGAYGGGFAIIPALHRELVDTALITERQFADAVAVGKLTPGPVLLMATFLGYVKEGLAGALVATLAILTPPFLLVVALSAWLTRVRSRRWVRAALRGLTPAVVGLMLAAALTLGQTMKTGVGLSLAAVTAMTLIRFETVNPVALLAVCGVVRLALHLGLGL